ncbi:hypothetical protein FY534_13895 (plasmid) [Alicyclobacillus sp. TC]|uniref:Uncharacterized protein n=1 Tax=Alicyclobacillus tolerans TaxID=90970 RepID=A0ABT9LYM2_9BACL|nr:MULTISPECIES: hypothetical protein [Alicyclobacillus]MDP9729371.1 hypothetical protein [Alicyclobacillus tengchongensis]QRF24866.1 hypothetical protein FY534_13895 [Alicyclobacillus sp. TC]
MSGKITISDIVRSFCNYPHSYSIKKPGERHKTVMHSLGFETKGSPNAPKGLPLPSQTVKWTVLVNHKQWEQMAKEYKQAQIKLKGSRIVIQGELLLEPHFMVEEGSIGVVAYKIECVEARKIIEEQQLSNTPQT